MNKFIKYYLFFCLFIFNLNSVSITEFGFDTFRDLDNFFLCTDSFNDEAREKLATLSKTAIWEVYNYLVNGVKLKRSWFFCADEFVSGKDQRLLRKMPQYYAQKMDISGELNFYIIGDLHGNYRTLSKIINRLTNNLVVKPGNKIIFLGDFIDRGPKSLETTLLIFILKAINPENIIILKGNHEDDVLYHLKGLFKEMAEKLQTDELKSKNEVILQGIAGFFLEEDSLNIFYKVLHGGRDGLQQVLDELKVEDEVEAQNLLEQVLSVENIEFLSLFYNLIKAFRLLPSVFYVKNDNFCFQFNHGGWYDFWDFRKYLSSTAVFCEIIGDARGVLWNEVDPFMKKGDLFVLDERRGIVYNPSYVIEKMKEFGITAMYNGHNHLLPKEGLIRSCDLSDENLLEPSTGVVGIVSKIFTIISGPILDASSEYAVAINYYPSYLRLLVNDGEWSPHVHVIKPSSKK